MNKIKSLILMLVVMLTSVSASAQMQLFDPVSWSTSVEQVGDGEYRIDFKATIEQGWHLYDLGPYEGGPLATTFTFDPIVGYELVGEVEPNRESVRQMDEIFEMEIGHYEGEVVFSQRVKAPQGATVQCSVEWQACSDQCVNGDKDFSIKVGNPAAAAEVDIEQSVADANAVTKGGSIWSFILSAIGWALIALLTPCVFPMIPMTVSFFLKGSGSVARGRFRALMYGLFIVVLYTVPIAVIILLTWLLGGDAVTADIFNWLSTHWLPNILFFVVFMVFAASFFGAFEIVLPEKLVNNSDAKADKGGLVGIFFMALTLVLVSFSCTGPIIGSALIQSTSGEVWTPILTMLAFSVVFALPFTLFALFPSWLKQLPKSGGWLNSVKVVLGFVELALGLKFLSVADQTYHWGLLDREVYLALWIAIFSLLGLYLLGKIKFKHDSDMPYLSVTRLVLAIVAFSFVVYMLPGMWGAPLKALSGYLPPIQTQDFVMGSGSAVAAEAATPTSGVKYGDVLELPHDLDGFFDLEEAEAYAKQVGKPLFIDFTGHGCVNCREMEARVWSDPRVLDILRNEYVIVALYADDKLKVDEADWVTTDAGKVLKTLGKINSYYALKTYGVNAQPYYVLQGNEGVPMVTPRGYDLDVQGFIDFLQSGVEAYKAGK
ncbi:MAG: thioredoxin family protein [Alistipes sp.]|nr:thioredoxin family protein [Alistipes sp.]MBR0332523.1 thioredoxin family protein [Alistipes sp.]